MEKNINYIRINTVNILEKKGNIKPLPMKTVFFYTFLLIIFYLTFWLIKAFTEKVLIKATILITFDNKTNQNGGLQRFDYKTNQNGGHQLLKVIVTLTEQAFLITALVSRSDD